MKGELNQYHSEWMPVNDIIHISIFVTYRNHSLPACDGYTAYMLHKCKQTVGYVPTNTKFCMHLSFTVCNYMNVATKNVGICT